ncbi:MAG: phosphoribosylglycinamide formyltransferase [Candidatus Rokuibacteriota bacterium]|nr:MAG: phosphoribosylglycinamide formyltransferase [Candidatus Rokubacteria bacterium]
MSPRSEPLRLGVLASGRGSNLQSIIDAIEAGRLPARLAVVVSDREQAPALGRAARHGAPALSVSPKDHGDRAAYDRALRQTLHAHGVELVCLAGFLRILGPELIRPLAGRVMNIHPSLLPAFPGLDAQRQALDWGVRVTGATVHFVDEGVDTGPIIVQEAVAVLAGDTAETLSERILAVEHRLYPRAIRLYAEERLRIVGRRVHIDPAEARPPA